MEKLIIKSGNSTPDAPAPAIDAGATASLDAGTSIPGAPKGSVNETEALKGADNAKIPPLSGFGTPLGAGQAVQGQSVPVGGLLDGMLAINLIDAVLPAILVLILFKAGMEMKSAELKLTEKEKNTLAPIVQKCLDQLMINFNNPWVALSFSACVIYGSKIIEKGGVKLLEQKAASLKKPDPVKPAAPAKDELAKQEQPKSVALYEPTDVEIRQYLSTHATTRGKARARLIAMWLTKQKRQAA